jgi:hypothetical protein
MKGDSLRERPVSHPYKLGDLRAGTQHLQCFQLEVFLERLKYDVKSMNHPRHYLKLTIVVYPRDLVGHIQDLDITLHRHIELEHRVQLG